MIYNVYESLNSTIEATEVLSTEVGNIVQDLYDIGCSKVIVDTSPTSPQLVESDYITSITFLYNGDLHVAFEGDYIAFDEEENPFTLTGEELENGYELVEAEMFDEEE